MKRTSPIKNVATSKRTFDRKKARNNKSLEHNLSQEKVNELENKINFSFQNSTKNKNCKSFIEKNKVDDEKEKKNYHSNKTIQTNLLSNKLSVRAKLINNNLLNNKSDISKKNCIQYAAPSDIHNSDRINCQKQEVQRFNSKNEDVLQLLINKAKNEISNNNSKEKDESSTKKTLNADMQNKCQIKWKEFGFMIAE